MRTTAASAARRRKTRKAPTKATVVALKPQDDVATYIAQWTPGRELSRKHWPATASVVRTLVTQAQPGGTSMAVKYLTVLARHTAIRTAAGMRIDDPVELLSDTTLAITLGTTAKNGLSENSRRTHLTFLRRIRARVLPQTYGQAPELTHLAKSPAAEPYSDEDVAALLTWCRSSSHPKAPRLFAAVLLSLGCGIDGFELRSLTGTDVRRSPWGLLVAAPGMAKNGTRPARMVPVQGAYEVELANLASKAGGDLLLGQTPRGLHELVKITAKTDSVPTFNAGRGRATWMRSLLLAGTGFVAMRQAGVSSRSEGALHALSKDITVPIADYVTSLRCDVRPFEVGDAAFANLTAWSQK